MSIKFLNSLFSHLTVQKLHVMQKEKGVVYKLHAGWCINRKPGKFINCGLISVEILQKEGKV